MTDGRAGGEVTARGGCLCGAVRFQVRGPLRPVVACHCRQCRRTSGHYVAATAARPEQLEMLEEGGLRWYRSSETARRGFCGTCGSSLLWWPDSGAYVGIHAGSLEAPTGLTLVAHIFTADAGDYYRIPDYEPSHPHGELRLQELWGDGDGGGGGG